METSISVPQVEAQAWMQLRDAIYAYVSDWVDINDDDTWASFKDDIDLLINDITQDIHNDRLKG